MLRRRGLFVAAVARDVRRRRRADGARRPAAASADRFDARPRVRGCCASRSSSARARRAPRRLRRLAERLRDAAARAGASRPCPAPGLRNVVGSAARPRQAAIVVGAHYDTKDSRRASSAPTTAPAGPPRCSSSRARCAGRPPGRRAAELRFVLFDGEEEPGRLRRTSTTSGLRGSRAYARAHTATELQAMILLDFVGREGRHADPARGARRASTLWARLRAAARQVGAPRRSPTRSAAGGHRRPHAVPAPRRARRST